MPFEIKLNNGKTLKGIIETLAGFIDETTINITPKEFIITAMDPSRISLLKIVIDKENFDEYECTKETKIGLNLSDLDKIMNRLNQKDIFLLSFEEKEQKIKIQMKEKDGLRTRTFSLMLLDLESEEIPIENLYKISYDTIFETDINLLIEAVKDAEIYSEIIEIKSTDDNNLIFESTGQIGKMEYQISIDDLLECIIHQKSKSAFSIAFLKNILKLGPITEKLEVSLKDNHPLKLSFGLIGGGIVDYFLAPRVEEVPDDSWDDEDFDDVDDDEF